MDLSDFLLNWQRDSTRIPLRTRLVINGKILCKHLQIIFFNLLGIGSFQMQIHIFVISPEDVAWDYSLMDTAKWFFVGLWTVSAASTSSTLTCFINPFSLISNGRKNSTLTISHSLFFLIKRIWKKKLRMFFLIHFHVDNSADTYGCKQSIYRLSFPAE